MISLAEKEKLDSLDVKSSQIHGMGLYTREDVKPGQIVYESDEYEVLPKPAYATIQKSKTEHLLEQKLRWENHSCAPNTSLTFSGPWIRLTATTSIPAGTEIVCDYRDTEDTIPFPFRCNCGHCSGIMIT